MKFQMELWDRPEIKNQEVGKMIGAEEVFERSGKQMVFYYPIIDDDDKRNEPIYEEIETKVLKEKTKYNAFDLDIHKMGVPYGVRVHGFF